MSIIQQIHEEFQALEAKAVEHKAKAQDFFAQYAAEVVKSSYGLAAKDFVVGMLRRAEEAGLFIPAKPEGKL